MRTLEFKGPPRIGIVGDNASVYYAQHWLEQIGLACAPLADLEQASVVLCAGVEGEGDSQLLGTDPTRIVLWDFQFGRSGTGLHAAAASGVSWVLGRADGLPLAMPVDVPEKWCGLIGANLAVSVLFEVSMKQQTQSRRVDVSAADTLRSFADQNSGNELNMDADWQRNGRTAVGHGGIFPQGYYASRDGYVGLIGRSRGDWGAIRDVIGRPAWCSEPRFDDPFVLADDSSEADGLLAEALRSFNRDDLLARAIEFGAPLAPVYAHEELINRDIMRKGFFAADGSANLPFDIVSHNASATASTAT